MTSFEKIPDNCCLNTRFSIYNIEGLVGNCVFVTMAYLNDQEAQELARLIDRENLAIDGGIQFKHIYAMLQVTCEFSTGRETSNSVLSVSEYHLTVFGPSWKRLSRWVQTSKSEDSGSLSGCYKNGMRQEHLNGL